MSGALEGVIAGGDVSKARFLAGVRLCVALAMVRLGGGGGRIDKGVLLANTLFCWGAFMEPFGFLGLSGVLGIGPEMGPISLRSLCSFPISAIILLSRGSFLMAVPCC